MLGLLLLPMMLLGAGIYLAESKLQQIVPKPRDGSRGCPRCHWFLRRVIDGRISQLEGLRGVSGVGRPHNSMPPHYEVGANDGR
jgi:hypothetical protein